MDHVSPDLPVRDNIDPGCELIGDCGLDSRFQGIKKGYEAGAFDHRVTPYDRGCEDLVDEIRFHGTSRCMSRGKRTASRMFDSPSIVMISRSAPRPHPAWGGIPYRNGRR